MVEALQRRHVADYTVSRIMSLIGYLAKLSITRYNKSSHSTDLNCAGGNNEKAAEAALTKAGIRLMTQEDIANL